MCSKFKFKGAPLFIIKEPLTICIVLRESFIIHYRIYHFIWNNIDKNGQRLQSYCIYAYDSVQLTKKKYATIIEGLQLIMCFYFEKIIQLI